MWNPSIRDLETIDDMANGRMAPARIASVLGIELQVFTAWNSRLAAARELDPDAVDRLCNPPKPVAVPPPEPQRESRIVAERIFEEIS
jgi:hypothetical protein